MGLKGLKGPNLVFMGGGLGNVVPTDRELQEELQNNTPPTNKGSVSYLCGRASGLNKS